MSEMVLTGNITPQVVFVGNITQVGTDEVYDDAVDVLEFEYEETEEKIEGVNII